MLIFLYHYNIRVSYYCTIILLDYYIIRLLYFLYCYMITLLYYHIDILLSNCPAGHPRHRAGCVLRSAFCVVGAKQRPSRMRKCTKKWATTLPKSVNKSSENRSKIIKNRSLEGSWDGLGEVLGQFWARGVPQGRPEPKKW